MLKAISCAVVLGAMTLLAVPSMTTAAPVSYTVDGSHSSVLFRIKHLNVAEFYGQFLSLKGDVVLDGNKSSLQMEVATDSVFTNNKKRDDHLKGPDFFDAKQFPKITFKSTKVTKRLTGGYNVVGDLTLRGKTKSIKFRFNVTGQGKDPWGNDRIGGHAEFTIKRSDFGITYMPKGLSENVRLIISIEGIKKK